MPQPPQEDTGELTDAQLATLRAALDALDAELREQLTHTTDEARPVSLDAPIGRLTRMDAMQQQHMSQELRRRLTTRASQIAGARRRMDAGEYGWCVECEEGIGFARLQVRPESPLCLRCQSALERAR